MLVCVEGVEAAIAVLAGINEKADVPPL